MVTPTEYDAYAHIPSSHARCKHLRVLLVIEPRFAGSVLDREPPRKSPSIKLGHSRGEPAHFELEPYLIWNQSVVRHTAWNISDAGDSCWEL